MVFTTLGLILGYRCNAKCRSCLWGKMLNNGPRMSIEDACFWVDQAYALGSLMLIGLSGGEPFLYMNEMKTVIQYASKNYELPSAASTNAFWAVTPRKAETTLRSLYDLGLRRLLVSVDDFHQEWVPLKRVQNCLSAAKSLGIHCTLVCVVTASSNKLSYYLEALGVSEGDNLVAAEAPCTPVGMAAIMLPNSDFPLHPGVPSNYCTLLKSLIIRPEGIVHLCCGAGFTVDALTAGNLREERLDSIIERAEWNPIFNALAVGNGPCHLATALAEEKHDDFLQNSYATSCHACHHILSRPGIEGILQERLESQRAELFLKREILDQIGYRNSDLLKI